MSEPAKYRKKPVVIEAMVWDGEVRPGLAITAWIRNGGGQYQWTPDTPQKLAIETLEGVITASPGDYIIKGPLGEFYPCKPDQFEAAYEPEVVQ